MAKYRVTGPDGNTYDVAAPDGASEADVMAYVQQNAWASSPGPSTPPPVSARQAEDQSMAAYEAAPPDTSRLGVGERFGVGAADPLYAAAQIAAHASPKWLADAANKATSAIDGMVGVDARPPLTTARLDAKIASRESDYEARRGRDAGVDWARMGGNMLAMLPLAAATPATIPGAVVSGGVIGGLSPVTNGKDFWSEKAAQELGGAAGGVAGNILGRGIARVIAPKTDPNVKALMARGVSPTPGQIIGGSAKAFEEKMTSIPILGDVIKGGQRHAIRQFNTAVYDDILRPLGIGAPKRAGRQAVADVGDAIGGGYDDILAKVDFRVDAQFGGEVENLRRLVDELPAREARHFTGFIQDKLARALGPRGIADGQTFKEIESSVSREARAFSSSTDVYQRKLGYAYHELLSSMRDALARSNAGVEVNVGGGVVDAGQRLKALNAAWEKLIRLELAAGSQGAPEGVFTPAQLSSAVKAVDQSVRGRAFSRGEALMQNISDPAREVIGNFYPDSGTAGRLVAMLMAGGAGAISPAAALAALPMAAYAPGGQRLTAALLAQRPRFAPQVGNAVRRALPAIQAGTAGALAHK